MKRNQLTLVIIFDNVKIQKTGKEYVDILFARD